MARDGEPRDPIWMFRRAPRAGKPGAADYDADQAVYRLYRNTRNPYLQRVLAPSVPRLERSTHELARLFRLLAAQRRYRVSPSNEEVPFRRRKVAPATFPAPGRRPRFPEPAQLPGDKYRTPWAVDDFFQSILARLRANPAEFAPAVEELMRLFKEHKVQPRLYQAYYTLESWDDLMATLEEIARYPAVETFDLFCGALLAYYDLAFPADER